MVLKCEVSNPLCLWGYIPYETEYYRIPPDGGDDLEVLGTHQNSGDLDIFS